MTLTNVDMLVVAAICIIVSALMWILLRRV
jgi:hypothetical protein